MEKQKIICELAGGLGNQLFCYAAGLAVAKKNNSDIQIDISRLSNDSFGRKFELYNFNVSAPVANLKRNHWSDKVLRKIRIIRYRTIKEEDEVFDNLDSQLFKFEYIYLNYNWHQQNFHLFHPIRETIIKEFTYKNSYSLKFEKIMARIDSFFTVSVHLRYGDYVKIGCCIDPDYYAKAITVVLSKVRSMNINKEVMLVVFSEDTESAQKIIKKAAPNINLICINKKEGLTDIEEFLLMKNCDAHVISNSTFSWWAAYLSEKKPNLVVAPIIKGWIKNEWENSFFPKEWLTIESVLKKE